MGLDFSHSDASWAYSGFMRFRNKLWHSCGFSGDLHEVYTTGKGGEQISDDHPLIDFFAHSDCDGDLTTDQMKTIEPAIRRILDNWQDGDYDKKMGLQLCDGMKEAISKNENLRFF